MIKDNEHKALDAKWVSAPVTKTTDRYAQLVIRSGSIQQGFQQGQKHHVVRGIYNINTLAFILIGLLKERGTRQNFECSRLYETTFLISPALHNFPDISRYTMEDGLFAIPIVTNACTYR